MSIIFKTFRTYAHPYVYDRHTNAVVMLTEDEYKELADVEKGELDAVDSAVIKRYQEQGLFQTNVVQKIEHSGTDMIEQYLDTRMTQLTLQVTQQCNLRCEYCTYSGIYDKNRTHNNARMSFDTAKKAIDYYLEHSGELSEAYIGFYGGEPLLEFSLIKKCVKYVENCTEGKKVRYNITTNGTLLSEEIVEFLVKYDFAVSISLDGSKHEHDISRKFKDGSGSFDTIIANIKRIREKHPAFDKKIHILTTINPAMDLGCVMEYFNTDEIFSDKYIMFNTMNDKDLKEEIEYDEKFHLIRQYEYIKCLFAIVGKLKKEDVSVLTSRSFQSALKLRATLHARSQMSKCMHHNGPCMPGARKLFVRTDGKFFPCERINELQEYFCIGSIDDGVNNEQCKKLLNIGKLTENVCKECWALRHCSICIAQIEFEDEPCFKDKILYCNSSKDRVLANLQEICVLNEFGIKNNGMQVGV